MKKKAELLRRLDASLEAPPPAKRPRPAKKAIPIAEHPNELAPAPEVPQPVPVPVADDAVSGSPADAPLSLDSDALALADSAQPAPAAHSVTEPAEGHERRTHAELVVRSYLAWSFGAGALPLPILDVAALTIVQVKMLREISAIYRIPFAETRARALVASLSGGLAPSIIAGAGAGSAIKALPGIGWFFGAATVAAFASASTYAVGHVFIEHFESGGTYLDFDPRTMRAFFTAKLQEGRQAVGSLRDELTCRQSRAPALAPRPARSADHTTAAE